MQRIRIGRRVVSERGRGGAHSRDSFKKLLETRRRLFERHSRSPADSGGAYIYILYRYLRNERRRWQCELWYLHIIYVYDIIVFIICNCNNIIRHDEVRGGSVSARTVWTRLRFRRLKIKIQTSKQFRIVHARRLSRIYTTPLRDVEFI